MITDLILFIVAIASLIIAAATGFYFRAKRVALASQIAQLLIDKQILIEQLATEALRNNAVEKTDGFLKFVSDSRDWAFQYIEETQGVITEIVNKGSIDDEDIQRLRSLLPKEIENN